MGSTNQPAADRHADQKIFSGLRLGSRIAHFSSGSGVRPQPVGDAPSDLQAARAAGVAAVGVTWGAFDYAGLASENPDAIATTPAELAGILLAHG